MRGLAVTAALCAAASAVGAAYTYWRIQKKKNDLDEAAASAEATPSVQDEVASTRPSSALQQLRVLPSHLSSVQQAGVDHVATIAGSCEFRQASLHAEQQAAPSAPPPVAAGPGLPIWRGIVNPIVSYRLPEAETDDAVFVNGMKYRKVGPLGTGASSQVFEVVDPLGRFFAVKRIALAGTDARAAGGYVGEMELLQKLQQKPNIIQVVDYQVLHLQGLIYLVLECGESSLRHLLQNRDARRRAAVGSAAHGALLTDIRDEDFIRLCWLNMLKAVCSVHEQRIVHRDIKPDNFVRVGHELKLIDFGIARAIKEDGECLKGVAAGTVPYMAPEALQRRWNNSFGQPYVELGRPSDVWSLGCILYEMVYGRQPYAHLGTPDDIMQAICSRHHQLAYPVVANPYLVDVMQRCLDKNPSSRVTVQELLKHPFLCPGAVNTASARGLSGPYRPF